MSVCSAQVRMQNDAHFCFLERLRKCVDGEVQTVCFSFLLQELLTKFLIEKSTNPESKVFYLKMKGDYFRYLAEVATGDNRKGEFTHTI